MAARSAAAPRTSHKASGGDLAQWDGSGEGQGQCSRAHRSVHMHASSPAFVQPALGRQTGLDPHGGRHAAVRPSCHHAIMHAARRARMRTLPVELQRGGWGHADTCAARAPPVAVCGCVCVRPAALSLLLHVRCPHVLLRGRHVGASPFAYALSVCAGRNALGLLVRQPAPRAHKVRARYGCVAMRMPSMA